MAVVAHTATPDKTDKVELEFWEINGDSGENSRTKVQNVSADSTGFSYPPFRLTRRLPANMLWELPVEEQPSEHRPGTDGFRSRVARSTHLRLGFLRVLQNAI